MGYPPGKGSQGLQLLGPSHLILYQVLPGLGPSLLGKVHLNEEKLPGGKVSRGDAHLPDGSVGCPEGRFELLSLKAHLQEAAGILPRAEGDQEIGDSPSRDLMGSVSVYLAAGPVPEGDAPLLIQRHYAYSSQCVQESPEPLLVG